MIDRLQEWFLALLDEALRYKVLGGIGLKSEDRK